MGPMVDGSSTVPLPQPAGTVDGAPPGEHRCDVAHGDPARTPVVVDGLRTPFGRYGGALEDVRPDDMAAHVISALVERTGIDPRPSTT